MTRSVAYLIGESRGGMRKHVAFLAKNPPSGFCTRGVFGPASSEDWFLRQGVEYNSVGRFGLCFAGRKASVIHAHGLTAGLSALTFRRPPVVVTLHTNPHETGRVARGRALKVLARAILARADAVIAVSEVGARFARPHLTHVIPPAFEPLSAPTLDRSAVRESLGVAQDVAVAICVCRVEKTKRVDLFLEVLRGANAVGVVVGDGPVVKELARQAPPNVKFLGYRDDISNLLAASDVFIFPSESEMHPLAVVEAVAAGLPVVAFATGSIPALVREGGGIVVGLGDTSGFVGAGKKLLSNPPAAQTPQPIDNQQYLSAIGGVYNAVL